jgi:hypothetical protein
MSSPSRRPLQVPEGRGGGAFRRLSSAVRAGKVRGLPQARASEIVGAKGAREAGRNARQRSIAEAQLRDTEARASRITRDRERRDAERKRRV